MSLKTDTNWRRRGLVEFIVIDGIIAYMFYDSIVAFFVLFLLIPIYIKRAKNSFLKEKKEQLLIQFCEMIGSLSTLLSAGLSVENSFIECRKEMEKMYTEKSYIVLEIDEIISKLKLNVPIENCLNDFSERSDIDEIRDFSLVFSQAIRSGGNLREVIKNTVNIIHDKCQIEAEISSMLKGKMLEQKVMSVIPFVIVLYLRLFNNEFLGVLYHNVAGVVVMTCCLLIYITSFYISERIVNISV